jgi:hypothetical protein
MIFELNEWTYMVSCQMGDRLVVVELKRIKMSRQLIIGNIGHMITLCFWHSLLFPSPNLSPMPHLQAVKGAQVACQ